MIDWVTSVIETIGYPGIAGLMVLEIFVPVVQSEIVMTFGGFTARNGDLNVYLVAAAGIVGSQVGSMALYGATRTLDPDRVDELLSRYGGWLGFTEENLDKAEDFFDDHDRWAVLLGRLLPGTRSFVAIPAGVRDMPVGRFFAYNLIGTAFWVAVLTALGAVLGDNYGLVDQYSSYITYAFGAAIAGFVVWRVVKVLRRHLGDEREPSPA